MELYWWQIVGLAVISMTIGLIIGGFQRGADDRIDSAIIKMWELYDKTDEDGKALVLKAIQAVRE